MKFSIKYLITLACVAIVSSCTNEDIVDSQSADEDVTVNLLLTTESEDGTMTRAMSDGKKVDKPIPMLAGQASSVCMEFGGKALRGFLETGWGNQGLFNFGVKFSF